MDEPLPNYIKMHRKQIGLTQTELGRLVGHKTASLILQSEKMEICPSLPVALACAKAFRMPADRLFEGIDRGVANDLKQNAEALRQEIRGFPASEVNNRKIASLDRIITDDRSGSSFFETRNIRRIIAFDLFAGGIAFAVLEESRYFRLVDYGRIESQGNLHWKKVKSIIARYRPSFLVAESSIGCNVVRRRVLDRFVKYLNTEAVKKKFGMQTFSRKEVLDAFAYAKTSTKHEIANVIADIFPELRGMLTRPREPEDEKEDRRINVFDAVALGITFLKAKS